MADMKWRPEDWARLGEMIRNSRDAQGYSRKKLSELSGVSEKSIQLTEEGRVPTRWPKSIDALERALGWSAGLSVAVLDGYSPENDPSQLARESGYSKKFEIRMPDGSNRTLRAEHVYPPASERRVPLRTAHSVEKVRTASPSGAKSDSSVASPTEVHERHVQDVFVRQMRRYRKLKGVSVEELASRVAHLDWGLDEASIDRIEAGVRYLPIREAEALAEALGTSLEWLLGSGFQTDGPEELTAPPDEEELKVEADAVIHRLREAGDREHVARQMLRQAHERAAAAQAEVEYALVQAEMAASAKAELERRINYLHGRIDTLRASRGEQVQPPYLADDQ